MIQQQHMSSVFHEIEPQYIILVFFSKYSCNHSLAIITSLEMIKNGVVYIIFDVYALSILYTLFFLFL